MVLGRRAFTLRSWERFSKQGFSGQGE